MSRNYSGKIGNQDVMNTQESNRNIKDPFVIGKILSNREARELAGRSGDYLQIIAYCLLNGISLN